MYTNVGKSIKTLAKVVAFFGVTISIIWGLIIILNAEKVSNYSDEIANSIALNGFIVMALGSLVSAVLTFFMYGFGQLIESVQNIEHRFCAYKSESSDYRNEYCTYNTVDVNFDDTKENDDTTEYVYCVNCGEKTDINSKYCHYCGLKR